MTAPASTFATTPRRLRGDLTFARQETPERRFVVVKDPDSGKYFKLGEAEEFIARQFDGRSTMDEIRRRVEAQFDGVLPGTVLESFAKTLESAGFFESDTPRHRAKPKLLKGSLLRIQLRAFNPNELLTRLVPRLRWCFTREYVIATVALLGLAVGIVAISWGEIYVEMTALLRLTTLPVVVAVIFTVVTLHEFGHGLTCKYFGGEVREMGAMLIYLQPAFYCDVSDAWMFPERWKRAMVSLAGPMVELTLWALAVLAWRVTEADTSIHHLALIIIACSGAHTLLNFNPFLKLDGYYLLGDLLAIPNLRRRAFAHVGDVLKRLAGLETPPAAPVSARERVVFLVYGTVASAGTFGLLAYILVSAGGYLLEGKQPVFMVASTALIAMRFRRRFKRLFLRKGGASDDDGDEDDGGIVSAAPDPELAAVPATTTTAVAVPPDPPVATDQAADDRRARKERDRRKRLRRRIGWGVVAAAALAWVAFGQMELKVAGAFTILPERNADVRSEIDGIVTDVLVDEGQHVQAGEVIVRLSAREQRAQLAGVQADVRRAQAKLQLLREGTSKDSIALAKAVVTRAEDAVRHAVSQLDRVEALDKMGAVTKVELESAQATSDEARNDLAEAQHRLDVLEAGSRPEEIQAAAAELDRFGAQEKLLSTQIGMVDVKSPAEGVVATPSRTLHELRGQLVAKGALLAKVFEMRALTIEIVVPEKDIADVNVDAPVLVRTRAYPGRTFSGRVVSIATAMQGSAAPQKEDAPVSSSTSSASATKNILVTTRIENPDLLLKPGMSGQAKILAGRRPVREIALRRLMRTVNLQVWSWL